MSPTAAASWASSASARATMRANRRVNTRLEVDVRSLLHAQGLRYRVDWPLPFDRRRRADIVFTRQRLAVFLDGCFWHACPTHFVPPKANQEFWREKMRANQIRDADTNARLEAEGWRVLRCWEHEDASKIAGRIRTQLDEIL